MGSLNTDLQPPNLFTTLIPYMLILTLVLGQMFYTPIFKKPLTLLVTLSSSLSFATMGLRELLSLLLLVTLVFVLTGFVLVVTFRIPNLCTLVFPKVPPWGQSYFL